VFIAARARQPVTHMRSQQLQTTMIQTISDGQNQLNTRHLYLFEKPFHITG